MGFTLLLLLAASQFIALCKGSHVVYKTTNVECITYPKYSENASCFVKAINWNKAVAQLDVDVKVTLRNISVHMEVFKKDYTNRYHPFLVNVQFNFCDIVSKKNYLAYGTILMKILKPYTNLNHSCPYTGHVMARNLYIDEAIVPILPLGFYLFSVKFNENFVQLPSESIGLVKFYAQAMVMVESRRKPKVSSSDKI